MPQRRDVFISYSREDKSWLDRLCVHLRPIEKRHKIAVWSDTRIVPGGRWQQELAAALDLTRVAVLLVSADFLSSEFITNNELPPLLEAAEKEGTVILPLIVSPSGFLRHESLRQFQPVNLTQPLLQLSKGDQEEVLERLADLIENLLTQLPEPAQAANGSPPAPSPKPAAVPQAASIPGRPGLWVLLREQLQRELDPEEFATWFLPLRVRNESEDRLVLQAPNARFLRTLEESYRPTLDRAVSQLTGIALEVVLSLEEEEEHSSEPPPTAHFNTKFRFDTFVVGRSNEFAYAAASAVAGSPSQSYNPLFVYGGVGLGKTHLLHAIGHGIQARYPHLRVLYLVAEQFVNELINSIRFDRMPDFRERYRTIDVLMIDDIQFLANKERTQEEFFHTFNTLYTSQKQIILSSDSSPRYIPTLEERLRSRFEWGLIADIQPPDHDTKMAIIRRKAELLGIHLPEDFIEFIAGQVRSNVREMEGLVNRVMAYSSLTGLPVTKALGWESLKDILPTPGSEPAASDIIRYVARHFNLRISEIKSRNKSRPVVFTRQVAMHLCKKLTSLSFPEIGQLFNGVHHSIVMYSVDKIAEMRKIDPDLDRTLQAMEKHFS